jgi:hypothetical protein
LQGNIHHSETYEDMHLKTGLVRAKFLENGYWKIKNQMQDSKINPGPAHKLKTTRETMNADLADHRQNTKIQNTCI